MRTWPARGRPPSGARGEGAPPNKEGQRLGNRPIFSGHTVAIARESRMQWGASPLLCTSGGLSEAGATSPRERPCPQPRAESGARGSAPEVYMLRPTNAVEELHGSAPPGSQVQKGFSFLKQRAPNPRPASRTRVQQAKGFRRSRRLPKPRRAALSLPPTLRPEAARREGCLSTFETPPQAEAWERAKDVRLPGGWSQSRRQAGARRQRTWSREAEPSLLAEGWRTSEIPKLNVFPVTLVHLRSA